MLKGISAGQTLFPKQTHLILSLSISLIVLTSAHSWARALNSVLRVSAGALCLTLYVLCASRASDKKSARAKLANPRTAKNKWTDNEIEIDQQTSFTPNIRPLTLTHHLKL
jgi:hypothetical protein